MNESPEIISRFFSKVNKTDTCWNWTGSKIQNGYGHLKFRGGTFLSHRASWIIHYGDIPKGVGHHGICVLHKCDNPACVKPDHFFLGTNQENMDDKIKKDRHPTVISRSKFPSIQKFAESGFSQTEIAIKLGVSQGHISKIIHKKRRVHNY